MKTIKPRQKPTKQLIIDMEKLLEWKTEWALIRYEYWKEISKEWAPIQNNKKTKSYKLPKTRHG